METTGIPLSPFDYFYSASAETPSQEQCDAMKSKYHQNNYCSGNLSNEAARGCYQWELCKNRQYALERSKTKNSVYGSQQSFADAKEYANYTSVVTINLSLGILALGVAIWMSVRNPSTNLSSK